MKTILTHFGSICLLGGALVVIGGCASMDSRNTEQLLSASGFEIKIADTSRKLANLQKLPPYKVVPQKGESGDVRFLYADPDNNRLFVGDQSAYQEYNRRAVQQNIATEQEIDAMEFDNAMFDWGGWELGW